MAALRRVRKCVLATLVVVALAYGAPAQRGVAGTVEAAGAGGGRVALVIGNSAYEAGPPLRNPVNDYEWCQDWYGDYPSGSVTDPRGASSGSLRVERGGGWSSGPRVCRSAPRGGGAPDDRGGNLGFRLSRSKER